MTDRELQDVLFKFVETITDCKVHTFAGAKISSRNKGLRLTFKDGSILQVGILTEKFADLMYDNVSST